MTAGMDSKRTTARVYGGRPGRRGSILMLALWLIAVLSVMVLSFAYEARQQAGLDVYVRERNRVRRIIDSGRMLAEVVLTGYNGAAEPEFNSGIPDWTDAFEDDRWCVEKYALKQDKKCTIGPLTLEDDDEEEEDGEGKVSIKVEIKQENATSKIDINSLVPDKDGQYLSRWQKILMDSGIDEELEVEVEDADRSGTSRHNLINLLIASWKDWTDSDEEVSAGPVTDEESNSREDDGAERSWYEERQEEDEIPEADRRYPANGRIRKLEELSYIRGFRDFPAVLTGGLLYPNEKASEENPRLTGIMQRFKISGGKKIAITDETTVEDLATVPGFFPEDFEDDTECADCEELRESVLAALRTLPEDDDDKIDRTRTWWPFKDMSDLKKRLDDFGCDIQLSDSVGEYLDFSATGSAESASSGRSEKRTNGRKSATSGEEKDHTCFQVRITGESLGMKCTVSAICYVDGEKVFYTEWIEDPSSVD